MTPQPPVLVPPLPTCARPPPPPRSVSFWPGREWQFPKMPRCHLLLLLESQGFRGELCRAADGRTRTRLPAATEVRLQREVQRIRVCPRNQGADVAAEGAGGVDTTLDNSFLGVVVVLGAGGALFGLLLPSRPYPERFRLAYLTETSSERLPMEPLRGSIFRTCKHALSSAFFARCNRTPARRASCCDCTVFVAHLKFCPCDIYAPITCTHPWGGRTDQAKDPCYLCRMPGVEHDRCKPTRPGNEPGEQQQQPTTTAQPPGTTTNHGRVQAQPQTTEEYRKPHPKHLATCSSSTASIQQKCAGSCATKSGQRPRMMRGRVGS